MLPPQPPPIPNPNPSEERVCVFKTRVSPWSRVWEKQLFKVEPCILERTPGGESPTAPLPLVSDGQEALPSLPDRQRLSLRWFGNQMPSPG